MASPGDEQIESWFPAIRADGYEVTGPEDASFNCIAWAAGKTDAWWEPIRRPGYYWLEEAPWDDQISSLVQVFLLDGFEECESDALEAGFEKVALYGKDQTYEHAARQLPDGRWTSKLGVYKDIAHNTLRGLVGTDYGSVVKILRKGLPAPPAGARQSNETTSEAAG